MINQEQLRKEGFIEFIKSIWNKEILFDCEIGGIVVDMYLPQKKLAIDMSGYFWAKDRNPKEQTKIAIKNGFRLIHIYDYEWYNYPENIKNFLSTIINSRGKHLIRNNVVQEISKNDFCEFLKHNHLFCDTINGCYKMYGIYENNELVAVSGFNKKKTKKYDWEWKRFAIKYGWMAGEQNVAELFLNEFSKEHKGILVDYQQIDRFNWVTDEDMGFKKESWNQGVVAINLDTLNFTRHDFIPEFGLNKQQTMEHYGFHKQIKTAGTVRWVKELA